MENVTMVRCVFCGKTAVVTEPAKREAQLAELQALHPDEQIETVCGTCADVVDAVTALLGQPPMTSGGYAGRVLNHESKLN